MKTSHFLFIFLIASPGCGRNDSSKGNGPTLSPQNESVKPGGDFLAWNQLLLNDSANLPLVRVLAPEIINENTMGLRSWPRNLTPKVF